jgi:hypothetical protein
VTWYGVSSPRGSRLAVPVQGLTSLVDRFDHDPELAAAPGMAQGYGPGGSWRHFAAGLEAWLSSAAARLRDFFAVLSCAFMALRSRSRLQAGSQLLLRLRGLTKCVLGPVQRLAGRRPGRLLRWRAGTPRPRAGGLRPRAGRAGPGAGTAGAPGCGRIARGLRTFAAGPALGHRGRAHDVLRA